MLSDLHLHLNGSISDSFLSSLSHSFEVSFPVISQMRNIEQIGKLSIDQRNHLVGKAFHEIHQVINNHEKIESAVLDVCEHSKAEYLEIRTTPKTLNQQPLATYVTAFCNGLKAAQKQFPFKQIYGMLSIDRNSMNLHQARKVLSMAQGERQRGAPIVAIDISGYPPKASRLLSKDGLRSFIKEVLARDLGLAIHVGESDLPIEFEDIDICLGVLEQYESSRRLQNVTSEYPSLLNKVRFGHAIFLAQEQIRRIRALQIPIEICPNCHEWINWWQSSQFHPISDIYTNPMHDPIVLGTDDLTIFGGTIATQYQRYINEIFPEEALSIEKLGEHHKNYRFG